MGIQTASYVNNFKTITRFILLFTGEQNTIKLIHGHKFFSRKTVKNLPNEMGNATTTIQSALFAYARLEVFLCDMLSLWEMFENWFNASAVTGYLSEISVKYLAHQIHLHAECAILVSMHKEHIYTKVIKIAAKKNQPQRVWTGRKISSELYTTEKTAKQSREYELTMERVNKYPSTFKKPMLIKSVFFLYSMQRAFDGM